MRPLAFMASVLVCALLAAGCNGDESSGGALESSLAYVPPDTPFAVAIDTDVEGDQYQALDDVLGRFPNGDALGRMLQDQIEQGADGVSYEDDVRPLLGNPFVVSATDPASFVDESEDDDFVAAIQVADTDALDGLIEKTDAREDGEVAGATVYEDDGTVFAVEDDMVVFGGTRELLEAALERADGEELSDEDLPLAAGEEAPQLVRIPGEVGFGLRDPSQVIAFFESTFQTLDPQGFGEYETGKRAISQRFDIDVDEDLFGQLTGDLSVSLAVDGTFGARAEVEDPDAFEETVERVAQALPQLGAGLGVTDVAPRGNP